MSSRRHKLSVLATATAVAATGAALGGIHAGRVGRPDDHRHTVAVRPERAARCRVRRERPLLRRRVGHRRQRRPRADPHRRVKRITVGSTTPTWRRTFSSLYMHEAPPPAPADVLGPEGMSAIVTHCSGARVHRRACQPRLIMSESNKGTHTTNKQIGRLYRLDPGTGRRTVLSNVGDQQWRWTKNHPKVAGPEPDSNPYAVLVSRFPHRVRTFVVDAGANTVVEVMRNGRTRVIALLPDNLKHDTTPTCVARGPTGCSTSGRST